MMVEGLEEMRSISVRLGIQLQRHDLLIDLGTPFFELIDLCFDRGVFNSDRARLGEEDTELGVQIRVFTFERANSFSDFEVR